MLATEGGNEHYREAERLLNEHRRRVEQGANIVVPVLLFEAQVHATLALTDATKQERDG